MTSLLHALFWLAAYLAAVLAPLVALLLAPTPPGGGFWWDLAIGLGFAALVMMAIQFLLTARFKSATAPFGIDLIYYFHRYLAYVLVAVVLAHPLILVISNPAHLPDLNPLGSSGPMVAGVWAVLLLIAIAATSAWRKRLAIPYDAWRRVHLVLAVGAVGLAALHVVELRHYVATPGVAPLWLLIGASLAAVAVWVRVLTPLRLLRTPYRVTRVEAERGSTWSLVAEPEGHDGFDFQPGQFAWVTLRGSPFAMREHPFSIASAPRSDGTVEFAIKELGDFTSTVGTVEPGERAYVDGPYGAFSIDRHPDASGYVFLAGGIGIAPMIAMLRALAERGDRRPHILFAAHSGWDRVPLREEIARLATRLELTVVHVLEEPHDGWEGERGWITREMLERHLPPDRAGLHFFICGPVPMIRAVESFLDELGVAASRVHTELFDLA